MSELYRICQYDTQRWNFPHIVESHFGRPLHKLEPIDEILSRETDQSTSYHTRLYARFPNWRAIFCDFVQTFVAEIISEDFFYQAIPNFRVHLQNNRAVGEFHTDAQYGHPDGEINFWLPMTYASGSNSIWLADNRTNVRPIYANPGDVLIFDGRNTLHGNQINKTPFSRVSFDFRILPVNRLVDSDAKTINTKMRFAPGSYYAQEPVYVK